MRELKIPPAVFRYVEHELYNYSQTKKELEEEKLDIIHGVSSMEAAAGGKSKEPGDPTASKGMKLVSSPGIRQMERVVAAIETALKMLNCENRMVFELQYQQGMGWEEICDTMPCSRRNYFRLRRDIVATVAVNLGLISLYA